MANWCKNFLRVTGPAEDVRRFQNQAAAVTPCQGTQTESTPEAFSFQRLVPLPAKCRTAADDTDVRGRVTAPNRHHFPRAFPHGPADLAGWGSGRGDVSRTGPLGALDRGFTNTASVASAPSTHRSSFHELP